MAGPTSSTVHEKANGALDQSTSTGSTGGSASAVAEMEWALRENIRSGWPAWIVGTPEGAFGRLRFTVRADPVYRIYEGSRDPQKSIVRASKWLTSLSNTDMDDSKVEIIMRELKMSMCRTVYGSNMIAGAGLGPNETFAICRRIFCGDEVVEELDEQRSRREVIQHAKALQYMIDAMVVQGEHLTETLIQRVHAILCSGIAVIHHNGSETPAKRYAGRYRTTPITFTAGDYSSSMFSHPALVPQKMERLAARYHDELSKAERDGVIDPFSLAAKYSLKFLQIHPFQAGNGRTCRIILNAILCKYAGIVIPIGDQPEAQNDERAEYLGIQRRAARAAEDMEGHGYGHGEFATFVLRKSVTRLRSLKQKLRGKRTRKDKLLREEVKRKLEMGMGVVVDWHDLFEGEKEKSLC